MIRAHWQATVEVRDGKSRKIVYWSPGQDSYDNLVFWLNQNRGVVSDVLQQYIDDGPRVVLDDRFVSPDN